MKQIIECSVITSSWGRTGNSAPGSSKWTAETSLIPSIELKEHLDEPSPRSARTRSIRWTNTSAELFARTGAVRWNRPQRIGTAFKSRYDWLPDPTLYRRFTRGRHSAVPFFVPPFPLQLVIRPKFHG